MYLTERSGSTRCTGTLAAVGRDDIRWTPTPGDVSDESVSFETHRALNEYKCVWKRTYGREKGLGREEEEETSFVCPA